MPHSVVYRPDLMDSILTPKRIQSYLHLFGNLTDREIVGIYIWNQVLGGALYPLMSAAEITLRNAIDSAFTNFSGKIWWKKIQYKSFVKGGGLNQPIPFDIKVIKENFVQAGDYVRKDKKRRYGIYNHKPIHEEIVASTDFFTWERLLTSELMGPNLFWGVMITKVFRGKWPSTSGATTLSKVQDLAKTIREYRNRLAHNEPLWKAYNVNTPVDAISYIAGKIDAIEQLISIISPEKIDLLNKHSLFSDAKRLNTLAEMNRFCTSQNPQWLGSFGDLNSVLSLIKGTNCAVHCRMHGYERSFNIIPY
ncbi:UNVERIFIED_ORG: hypothetical protein M2402_004969 [Rahnella aquatilis]